MLLHVQIRGFLQPLAAVAVHDLHGIALPGCLLYGRIDGSEGSPGGDCEGRSVEEKLGEMIGKHGKAREWVFINWAKLNFQ